MEGAAHKIKRRKSHDLPAVCKHGYFHWMAMGLSEERECPVRHVKAPKQCKKPPIVDAVLLQAQNARLFSVAGFPSCRSGWTRSCKKPTSCGRGRTRHRRPRRRRRRTGATCSRRLLPTTMPTPPTSRANPSVGRLPRRSRA